MYKKIEMYIFVKKTDIMENSKLIRKVQKGGVIKRFSRVIEDLQKIGYVNGIEIQELDNIRNRCVDKFIEEKGLK